MWKQEESPSLNPFKIAETDTFIKKRKSAKYQAFYPKILEFIYPIIRINPFFGPHIKKLKGDYKDIYRYRIGEYRLLYKIEGDFVYMLAIVNRKDAY